MTAFLGIDVAKKKFDAALLREGKFKTKIFDNSQTGFHALLTWLNGLNVEKVHVCMEATGNLYEGLALFLYDASYEVSVINPFQIKSFGKTMLSRTKTDKADARLIAKFCEAIIPPLWEPDLPEIRALRDLGRRRDALINMRTQEKNREIVENPRVIQSIQAIVAILDKEIEEI
jgi:transposase